MLCINSKKYNLDVEYFEKSINKDGFDVYVNNLMYTSILCDTEARFYTVQMLLIEKMQFLSQGAITGINSTSVASILKDYLLLEESGLLTTKSRKISLDMTKVILPLVTWCREQMGRNPVRYSNAVEFCNLYIEYSKLKNLTESMNAEMKFFMKTDKVDNSGMTIVKTSSLYDKRSTGRYYTNNRNLQGWSKETLSTLTAPKDYYLVWADFDQIDLRVAANLILFNGHPEVIEQFDKTSDKYEAIARIMANKLNIPFDLDKFKVNRKGYKTAVLARLYGANQRTLKRSLEDWQERSTLDNYYKTHEYYQKYVNTFNTAIGFDGDVVIEDYFGFTRRIDAHSSRNKDRILEQCLNTPIQSTSNDIVMLWINEITKRFRELGFNSDKFTVYLVRHDEGIFLLHKDTLPYLWIFKECSKIFIDSWSELTVEPKLGFNYKIVNDNLTKEYEKSVNDNTGLITKVKGIMDKNHNWEPCKKTIEVYSYVPMNPLDFACYILKYDPEWSVELQILKEKIENKKPDAYKFACDTVREYKTTGKRRDVLEYINFYNKYFNFFLIKFDTDKYQRVDRTDFIKYLNENNIGYVYVHNALVTSYQQVGDIQLKYDTDIPYKDLVGALETYG